MIILPMLFIAFFTVASFNATPAVTKIPTNEVQHLEGQKIYKMTCAKCHNLNPHIKGSIGPDLYTTPREVFHTKVVTGTYPKDYTPKRKTRTMPRFKHLTTKVDLIYDYIQSIKKE